MASRADDEPAKRAGGSDRSGVRETADQPHDKIAVRTFSVGDRLLGRYRILRRLGEGAMGVVYEALDEESNGDGSEDWNGYGASRSMCPRRSSRCSTLTKW